MKNFKLHLLVIAIFLLQAQVHAQIPAAHFNAMQWRMIGPHRGGRTVGAVGVPQQPNVFYIGVNNGGVWKTTDYGRTWFPIFDDQPTGSIGDVAVAPSDPNIVYVASGEGIQRPDLSVGNGMYKSIDAGKTWTHLGLDDGQQIGGISIDPTNPNRLFVAVLGHPYGPNTTRGIYRSINGGASWEQVLYKDENTGAVQVTIDPNNPNIIYADLWAGRQAPWENGDWNGKESGLFKSIDGGTTWTKLTNGLPTVEQGLGRIGFCIAPTNSNRLYATVDAGNYGGMYRSDDAGATWKSMSNDGRYWGRGSDFAEVKVDPKNEDIVYTANVVVWKSIDGGKNWKDYRGAPGGDDYHRIWINPNNSDIVLIAADQGAMITVNGGQSFSSWNNQPTAQFYHVSADNAFPYNVYGAQQESGSVGIASRGNDGAITLREWHPVGVEEYGYIAPDPLDPNIIYGGKITKYDKRTGQVQSIAPEAIRSGKYRFLRTAPVLFSPIDPTTLYFAGNVLFKTKNGGSSWEEISPDLTRKKWSIPNSVGIYTSKELETMPHRGVIYTVAPSPKDIQTIWCGTDDGLIQITKDGGKNWKDVTPSFVDAWKKVSMLEASHFDASTVYAAVNGIRTDDMAAHIYKSTDNGNHWIPIVSGLPNDPINTIKEDPITKGLLFAGSERATYVSFDDGAHWQTLQLNMPCTSIRDLIIKDDDLVVGTHGRSFWILDNITPLRVLANARLINSTILYKPQNALRIRWSNYTDTPIPQEEPAGANPPEGAMIDYYLQKDANSVVKLIIKDEKGNTITQFASDDKPYTVPAVNIPLYWIRPQQILSAKAGSHRFMWDMHYTEDFTNPSYPMSAIYGNTAPAPTAPWVMPGNYTVTLQVDGMEFTQTILVKMDPRVKTSWKDLQAQHDNSLYCWKQKNRVNDYITSINSYLNNPKYDANTKAQLAQFIGKAGGRRANVSNNNSFNSIASNFDNLLHLFQASDFPATTTSLNALAQNKNAFIALVAEWEKYKKQL
jgi:photosystem II stability/assembly factor-like uncharacterized protein